ncbi:pentatricopeptide repeat-containing protein At5g61370, mitochondrial [Diospyros lotus]|uniref:pentatricopeptide repeat-containing protein At5g61370, mitochondrial n=1 Tax=Diospyros lotus TaxID=55363 RepID=UPI0022565DD5|nr:pentatricopeptide repeat-containing protein At5g61370, mitochondrial [Diospyros lotus]XP_052176947.1 pentatricopeptide repeat-containing protein At5g61370, mitochondrial [Diospyros lotus]XP_052176948.1 pentatricopeptide repeat-containing protein At5g61370, mitochondrial [Diospyros lotus]
MTGSLNCVGRHAVSIEMKQKWLSSLLQTLIAQKPKKHISSLYCTMSATSKDIQELCTVVSSSIGGLDELEATLSKLSFPFTASVVTEVLDSCKNEAPTRRLLRFFSWSSNNLDDKLEDKVYNHAIRVFAEKKDFRAMDILISDLCKEGREMETSTFSLVAETLVKLGREEAALGIFKNLDKFKCPRNRVTVMAIVSALCAKGHAKRAEGVVWHHKDKISGIESCIYRSILYGWSEQKDVKEARRIIKEMKAHGVMPDLFCYNTFLRCLCERNLKSNPSGLVPEALNVMMEMRSYGIIPTSISYNILLSCLSRARRIKESLQILERMTSSGCSPDWVSYYLVARILYLTGRFGKGKQIVGKMIEKGLVPERTFYYGLIGILCGVERVNYALELFEQMKKSSLGGYGPVYDLLIPKLCRGGEFEKGRELWDEATALGILLRCSRDELDPSITKVFKPQRKVKEEVNLHHCAQESRPETAKAIRKENKSKKNTKKKNASHT